MLSLFNSGSVEDRASDRQEASSVAGTLTIDTTATFQAVLLMASGPKLKFGSTEQDISARGERKWEVQAAVTYHAEPGMKPISEVISVTVTGPGADPCASITPGAPIVLDKLRVGFSVPEARENGRGIRGGRPWYQAADVHQQPAQGSGKSEHAA
jgi:hypothetical protein